MDLDWQKLDNYNQMFQQWKAELFPRGEYAHRNECCFAFAHLLAKKAKEQGMLPLKIWCLKSYDADHVQAKFPADNANGFETRDWQGYHVALAVDLPIYKNSQKTERLVFDPIVYDAPVREKDWQKALNSGEPYIMYSGCKFGKEAAQDTSFFDGSGYWLDKDPTMDLDRHARLHIKAIKCPKGKQATQLKSPLMILSNIAKRKDLSHSAGHSR